MAEMVNVDWTIEQQSISEGSLHSMEEAMKVWNDDPYTHINLQYVLLSKNDPTLESRQRIDESLRHSERINNIDFKDENEIIPGSFDCSKGGAIAVSGIWTSLGARETFRNISFSVIQQVS